MRALNLKFVALGFVAALALIVLYRRQSWQLPIALEVPALHHPWSSTPSAEDEAEDPSFNALPLTPIPPASAVVPISPFITSTSHPDYPDETAEVSAASDAPDALSDDSIMRTLVIAKTKDEDTDWIEDELGDLIHDRGWLKPVVYVVNDHHAEYTTPVNKGHEAMVYLTYIIDHYTSLPDISIFMHSHSGTWHNNDIMNQSSSALVRYLTPRRVLRDGYVNLRCQWEPGCPDWLHPDEEDLDINKQEQAVFARAWRELFPVDPVPKMLAQPCCAQFAVSRDTVHRNPLQRYVDIRSWLWDTTIDDHDSGRVFEYLWQYLFSYQLTYCPNPRLCYCEGYGVCFTTHADFDAYFRVQRQKGVYEDELSSWRERLDFYESAREHAQSVDPPEFLAVHPPNMDRGPQLEQLIQDSDDEMTQRKAAALMLGQDPVARRKLIELTLQQLEGPESLGYDWRALAPWGEIEYDP